MKLKIVKQALLNEIQQIEFDVFITSSGYETRCRYLSEKVKPKAKCKYTIVFKSDQNILAKRSNDTFFSQNKFELYDADGDSKEVIIYLFENILTRFKQDKLILLVDYSSMSRVWYASLLNLIRENGYYNEVIVYCSYTKGKFVKPPKDDKLNIHVGPIEGFSSLSIPNKPSALIIGLGYEKNRAYGLNEYLDAETFLFYTDDTTSENPYCRYVESSNSEIINQTKKGNIFKYNIDDLNYSFYLLNNLCNDLTQDYRVIIAPCGPKPFTLLSILISIKNSEIDVWRISPGKSAIPIDYQPINDPIILIASFVKDPQ